MYCVTTVLKTIPSVLHCGGYFFFVDNIYFKLQSPANASA